MSDIATEEFGFNLFACYLVVISSGTPLARRGVIAAME
jgi:hypothetical protein